MKLKKLASVSIDEKEQIFLSRKLLENVTVHKNELQAMILQFLFGVVG